MSEPNLQSSLRKYRVLAFATVLPRVLVSLGVDTMVRAFRQPEPSAS